MSDAKNTETAGKTFTLSNDQTGEKWVLPVVSGTLGPDTIDIRSLYEDTGVFTLDPSFTSTASCKSRITFIDGDKGVLLHRGYNIKDLAEKSNFVEVAYLLLYGDLPNKKQFEEFRKNVTYHTMVHEQLQFFFRGFRRDAHPMAVMCGVVGALAAFYHDSLDISDPQQREISAHRLIAKLPTLAAMAFKPYKVSPVIADAMDKILILHADHEQNASTSTVRLAGSSQANPFACIAAGIASLWGPAHGGANQAVLEMLQEIGNKDRIPEFIQGVKDKKYRLMGFGHRVYKNFDPRATVMKEACDKVLAELGIKDPLLEIAMEMERIALSDPYFVERKLYPNVDFYSGIILKAMGFPISMFTVLFAMARTVGWVSQWKEMMEEPSNRIGRPRQLYTGAPDRDYVPVDKR